MRFKVPFIPALISKFGALPIVVAAVAVGGAGAVAVVTTGDSDKESAAVTTEQVVEEGTPGETCGRLLDATTLEPIAGATIAIITVTDANNDNTTNPLSTTTSDTDGTWCLTPIDASATTGWAIHIDGSDPGYETGWPSTIDPTTGNTLTDHYAISTWDWSFQAGEGNTGTQLGDIHLQPEGSTAPTTSVTPPSSSVVAPTTSTPIGTTTTSVAATSTSTTPTTPTTSSTTTTTLAPAPPVISSASSGSGSMPLPSECTTRAFVTVVISDPNNDPMSLQLNWSSNYGSPASGSTTYSGLSSGTHRLLLGTFDYSHRLATISVTMTLTDPTARVANRGFLINADSSGNVCPSVFG